MLCICFRLRNWICLSSSNSSISWYMCGLHCSKLHCLWSFYYCMGIEFHHNLLLMCSWIHPKRSKNMCCLPNKLCTIHTSLQLGLISRLEQKHYLCLVNSHISCSMPCLQSRLHNYQLRFPNYRSHTLLIKQCRRRIMHCVTSKLSFWCCSNSYWCHCCKLSLMLYWIWFVLESNDQPNKLQCLPTKLCCLWWNWSLHSMRTKFRCCSKPMYSMPIQLQCLLELNYLLQQLH